MSIEFEIDEERLEDYFNNKSTLEMLAKMIIVNVDTMDVEVVPRSRQYLLSKVDSSEDTVDKYLNRGVTELNILRSDSGSKYKMYPDNYRVYRINQHRLSTETLREIKKKGYYRSNQPHPIVDHADVEGGRSDFSPLPDWEPFVKHEIIPELDTYNEDTSICSEECLYYYGSL